MDKICVHDILSKELKLSIKVQADKSISHRTLILSSLAEGTTRITNLLKAEDTLHTLEIFRNMGVKIVEDKADFIVTGVGLRGLKKPDNILDVGNSGTAIRLLLGILATQQFDSVITGDASIQTRPMKRVVAPLSQMGASFKIQKNNNWVGVTSEDKINAPLQVVGGSSIKGINYTMPVSSAQIKSALLFAGMYADKSTTVLDPGFSRDHSERMLRFFEAEVITKGKEVTINPVKKLVSPKQIAIPGDISSAAFWLVLGCIHPNAIIKIANVGLNPTRTGIITVLENMGANIIISNVRQQEGEPIGDVEVRSSSLKGIVIKGEIIPTLIDEIPIIAVLASFAEGETEIRDASELKVKESNRISTTLAFLKEFSVKAEELEDGMIIYGKSKSTPASCKSFHDHRIAMSSIVMALVTEGESCIMETECINTSYPGFFEVLSQVNLY